MRTLRMKHQDRFCRRWEKWRNLLKEFKKKKRTACLSWICFHKVRYAVSSLRSFQMARHDLRTVWIFVGVARRSGIPSWRCWIGKRCEAPGWWRGAWVALSSRVGCSSWGGFWASRRRRKRTGRDERGQFLGGKRKTGRCLGILGKFHNFFVFNYVFLFFIIFKIDKFIF